MSDKLAEEHARKAEELRSSATLDDAAGFLAIEKEDRDYHKARARGSRRLAKMLEAQSTDSNQ